jgi:hypothetical protein
MYIYETNTLLCLIYFLFAETFIKVTHSLTPSRGGGEGGEGVTFYEVFVRHQVKGDGDSSFYGAVMLRALPPVEYMFWHRPVGGGSGGEGQKERGEASCVHIRSSHGLSNERAGTGPAKTTTTTTTTTIITTTTNTCLLLHLLLVLSR